MSEKAVSERLLEIEGEINAKLLEICKDFGITWYLTIRHNESGLAVHTGAGCAVCSVIRSIRWLAVEEVQHTNDNEIHDTMGLMIATNTKGNEDGTKH